MQQIVTLLTLLVTQTVNVSFGSVVVVYHVTIVAIGHGLLKKFWPLVLGCVLRTAGSSIIQFCAFLTYHFELL